MITARILIMLLVLLMTQARWGEAASMDTWQSYGAGVNILSDDPIWTDQAKSDFRWDMLRKIKAAGFRHVRVNLYAFSHMNTVSGKLDTRWLGVLDTVLAKANAAGLQVILDEHDFEQCGSNADMCQARILSFWRQVAVRYRNAPPSVLFEILNEPNNAINPSRWNRLLGEALRIIRQTNPTRTIIVGPPNFNNFRDLNKLVLPPEDRNILVAIHYYEPAEFTLQGASWTSPSREERVGVSWGEKDDYAALDKDFSNIASWSRSRQRPVIIDEFGAYYKADFEMRVAWSSAVARAARRNGMAWTWWQFGGESFPLYDIRKGKWIDKLKDPIMRYAK